MLNVSEIYWILPPKGNAKMRLRNSSKYNPDTGAGRECSDVEESEPFLFSVKVFYKMFYAFGSNGKSKKCPQTQPAVVTNWECLTVVPQFRNEMFKISLFLPHKQLSSFLDSVVRSFWQLVAKRYPHRKEIDRTDARASAEWKGTYSVLFDRYV